MPATQCFNKINIQIMEAILKEIEVYAYNDSMLTHRIKMVFTESLDSDELYYFGTSIEQQFCTKEELNQLYTEDEYPCAASGYHGSSFVKPLERTCHNR